MTNKNENNNKDERALDALLTAAFRLDFSEKMTDEQVELLFQKDPCLSEEDKLAISNWGTELIENLLKGKKTVQHKGEQETKIDQELNQEYIAMNRDKDGEDIDDETKRKIDNERKKAIEEEDKKENE